MEGDRLRVRIGQVLFRHRGWLPIPFFLLALVASCPSPTTWFLSGMLILLGEGIRILSVAHSGPTTRARHITAPRLALSGPYAWVRHPIYLGNFLVGGGFVAFLTSDVRVGIAYAVLFWLEYYLITEAEEAYLLKHFESYQAYRSKVPRFIPWKGRVWKSQASGNLGMAMKSERSTFLLILGIILLGGLKVALHCPSPW